MIDLNEKETKVVQIALDALVTALDGLPLKDEDELFGIVVEALDEQVVMEGDVLKTVLAIREKVSCQRTNHLLDNVLTYDSVAIEMRNMGLNPESSDLGSVMCAVRKLARKNLEVGEDEEGEPA